ncbi:hypothetical protein, partial [Enterobacter sichuanensis]
LVAGWRCAYPAYVLGFCRPGKANPPPGKMRFPKPHLSTRVLQGLLTLLLTLFGLLVVTIAPVS